MPVLLQLQKLPWKGDAGWREQKVSLRRFGADQNWDREFVEKTRFSWGIPKHEQQVIAYFQTHYDYVPQNMPLTLAV